MVAGRDAVGSARSPSTSAKPAPGMRRPCHAARPLASCTPAAVGVSVTTGLADMATSRNDWGKTHEKKQHAGDSHHARGRPAGARRRVAQARRRPAAPAPRSGERGPGAARRGHKLRQRGRADQGRQLGELRQRPLHRLRDARYGHAGFAHGTAPGRPGVRRLLRRRHQGGYPVRTDPHRAGADAQRRARVRRAPSSTSGTKRCSSRSTR